MAERNSKCDPHVETLDVYDEGA